MGAVGVRTGPGQTGWAWWWRSALRLPAAFLPWAHHNPARLAAPGTPTAVRGRWGAKDWAGIHKSCRRHGAETRAGGKALSTCGPSHLAVPQGPTTGWPAASAGHRVFLASEVSNMLRGGSAMAGGRLNPCTPVLKLPVCNHEVPIHFLVLNADPLS